MTQDVQVCVLTYKRPLLLRATLHSLLQQTLLASSRFRMHVLVVDNDPKQSGRAAFDSVMGGGGVAARYVGEPARGLAIARNRALEESAAMDFMAFIDDDEVADPRWLQRLLKVQEEFDADVVTGPVEPCYSSPPAWLVRGGFFARRSAATGPMHGCVATNNVLLRGDVARRSRFDPRFNATGGEDTNFFQTLAKQGARIAWADDAVVFEDVPAERMKLRWLLRRASSDAGRFTRSCMVLEAGWKTRLLRAAKAVGGLLTGALMLPLGILGGHYSVRGLQLIWRAAGTLKALQGHAEGYYGESQPAQLAGVPAAGEP